MDPVVDLRPRRNLSVSDLVTQFSHAGGFTAKKLADGVDILENTVRACDGPRFLSFPAALMATGCRGYLTELVKRKLFDVVITTCGTLDHDLARTWAHYYSGTFEADDAELRKKGINRLGNVFVPNESYGIILEKRLQPFLQELYGAGKRRLGTHEFNAELGRLVSKEKNAEQSLLYWAWKNQIPVIVPGPTDGAVGYQAWEFSQDHDFVLDVFRDEKFLSSRIFSGKKSGALMLGGGISKHHVIWWSQFRDGLDYAVYVTTAPEWDGSLSGARTREAISWGKLKAKAKHVTVEGEASVLLPLMAQTLFDRLDAGTRLGS